MNETSLLRLLTDDMHYYSSLFRADCESPSKEKKMLTRAQLDPRALERVFSRNR